MTAKARQVVVNLDLDEDLFRETFSFLKSNDHFTPSLQKLEEMERSAEEIELVALFVRRADGSASSVANAISRIEEIARYLEQVQMRHAVKQITLIDCGEIPSAPLSDFSAVAQYLETLATEMSPDASARVFAVDHDFSADPASVRLFDTLSADFLDHFVAYTTTSLQMLNTGFGTGKLPD